MKRIISILLKIVASLIALVIIIFLAGWIFISTAPQFGAVIQGDDLKKLEESPNFNNGIFQNLVKTTLEIDAAEYPGMLYNFLFSPSGIPSDPIPTDFSREEISNDSSMFVTWFGHSAILLEMNGQSILIDPMLGSAAAPVSFTSNRFPYSDPIDISDIGHIDILIISHDHYDHLDYPTIIELKDRVDQFVTPLGVGSHLKKWGVDPKKITELDWWQTTLSDGIELTAAPARHFSGRRVGDQNCTLWASWIIKSASHKVYFSGDGGYADHFKEIGENYGPFDFAMLECGQYNELWSQIHMMPEETAQAGVDLQADIIMPIHWGAFKLAPHHWKDPIERVQKETKRLNIDMITPVIGNRFDIASKPKSDWWRTVN